MVQNGPEWSKLKMVKNGGPDLKRARPTGLSTRRTGPPARSRGPLAPRLLVQYIFVDLVEVNNLYIEGLGVKVMILLA